MVKYVTVFLAITLQITTRNLLPNSTESPQLSALVFNTTSAAQVTLLTLFSKQHYMVKESQDSKKSLLRQLLLINSSFTATLVLLARFKTF